MRLIRVMMLAAVAGLAGCFEVNPDYLIEPPPRADEAIALVKLRLGGTFEKIRWYGPASFVDCPEKPGTFRDYNGDCVEGMSGLYGGSIVAWDGIANISMTALTHEMIHQTRGDPKHKRLDVWGTDYPAFTPGTIIGDINLELERLGM